MRTLLITLFLLFCAAPSLADQASDTQAVEEYLNGIHTLKSRFTQTDNDGNQITGDFHLMRPGRMRFQYDPPVQDFIVADGLFIYYYDAELKQQSNAPIGKSLADFFLRKNLTLSGDVEISQIQRGGGLLQVTLAQAKDPLAGSLTLGFTEKPLKLRKWRVVDGQGAITEVALDQIETGIDLKSSLFKYYDPERKRAGYN